MDIQIVPKKQVDAVSFGAPEGMRVFLGTAGMVVGALDYLYSGGRLTFSSAHTHDGVKSMVTALNALEKRYRAVKGLQSVQLIHFLLSPSPYIMVKNKNIRDFYYWPNGRTMKISKEKLKKQIKQILDSRPSYITTKP
ncbi:MAG TPA: hypothetical protein VK543_09165 [Puia sp.]|nr:hypothetical protein [Puia sp.]